MSHQNVSCVDIIVREDDRRLDSLQEAEQPVNLGHTSGQFQVTDMVNFRSEIWSISGQRYGQFKVKDMVNLRSKIWSI